MSEPTQCVQERLTRTLSEAILHVQNEAMTEAARVLERVKENVRKVETNYTARDLLAAVGIDLAIGFHLPTAASLRLENPKDMVKVRKALDVRMKVTGRKEPVEHCSKRVWVYVKAEGFDGLNIRYQEKIRKGAKCRIIRKRHSYTSSALVCES